jgi:hypothetical protein
MIWEVPTRLAGEAAMRGAAREDAVGQAASTARRDHTARGKPAIGAAEAVRHPFGPGIGRPARHPPRGFCQASGDLA